MNELAARRIGPDKKRQAALRETKSDKRLNLALHAAGDRGLRTEIEEWYELRSDAAHGERLTSSYNVAAVFARAFELHALVNAQPG